MDFSGIEVGTRRASTVSGLGGFSQSQSLSHPNGAAHTSNNIANTERRRSSILSLANHDVRRRSSAINLNFDNRKGSANAVDEPILLCKEKNSYLFFSMTSDGMLNYKVAGKVQGSMSQYLVDPTLFNQDGAPIVVLSSPASGTGLAPQTYSRLLLPIFKHFKVPHSHIVLKDKHTATFLASNGQFTPDTIFVLLGGDGVVHEVINGLSHNPHFERTNTPIKLCPIPTGSGNGLASSLKIGSIAQGIRAIFKNNFQPLPLMSVSISDHEVIYAAVVVSFGLHAALVRDCASQANKERYGNDRFKEVAKKHLYPSPYLYSGDLVLNGAARFPNFAGPESTLTVGEGKHSYCLITRCSNLEQDWKIAPLANPIVDNGKLDIVRMGALSGAELGSVLMDAYRSGSQINRKAFEYYRASGAGLKITETNQDMAVLCIDGVIIELEHDDEITINVCQTIGAQQTKVLVQKL